MRTRLAAVLCALCLGLWVAACDDDPGTTPNDGAADAKPDAPGTDAKPDAPAKDGALGDGKGGDGKLGDGKLVDGKKGDAKKGDGLPWWPDFYFYIPDGANPGNQVPCHGKVYVCSDGVDNDADGLIDSLDPECTGPCDNSEGSFLLEIPGVNRDPCAQDCYWDYNSGAGNDGCDWNHQCDPLSPGAKLNCPYDKTYTKCTKVQNAMCLSVCPPLTPNGCDCFGCCEVYVNGKKYGPVFLGSGSGCTATTPSGCALCTQQPGCNNPCGVCELCLGKTIKDLPASCFQPKPVDAGPPKDYKVPDGPPWKYDGKPPDAKPKTDGGGIIPWPWCPTGVTPCLNNSHCPVGYYCITGCCKITIS